MKVISLKVIIKRIAVVLAAVIALRCVTWIPVSGTFIENAAVLSAGIIMPEGVAGYYAAQVNAILAGKPVQNVPVSTDSPTEAEPPEETEAQPPPETTTAAPPEETTQAKPVDKGGDIQDKKYGETDETIKFKNVVLLNRTASHKVNIEETLNKKVDLSMKKDDKPYVLIFHTHTTEAYQDADRDWYPKDFKERSLNSEKNMIRVGDEICKQLEAAGIGVIHDKNVYDNPSYTGAYERSGKKIDEYLKKYPSIQIILDVHRDSIQYDSGTKSAPTVEIDGKKAAQIMIISGCQEGDMTGFDDWGYNLRFALKLQKAAETATPGLMRPLFFAPRKYNMHKSHCSLLLEMGSDGNTLEEAVYSGELIGKALVKLCADYTK